MGWYTNYRITVRTKEDYKYDFNELANRLKEEKEDTDYIFDSCSLVNNMLTITTTLKYGTSTELDNIAEYITNTIGKEHIEYLSGHMSPESLYSATEENSTMNKVYYDILDKEYLYVVLVKYINIDSVKNSAYNYFEVVYMSRDLDKAKEKYNMLEMGIHKCLNVYKKYLIKTELDIDYLDTDWLCNQETLLEKLKNLNLLFFYSI